MHLFKLLRRVADYSVVQKSALVTGLALALCAAGLGGIAEWAGSGGPDSNAEGGSRAANSTVAETTPVRLAAAPPLSSPGPAASNDVASDSSFTFRKTVPEVRLEFTATDEHGRLAGDLTADDIRVIDNQVPVAHLRQFARDENLPLRLGILLDVSDSVKRYIGEEKNAVLKFLDQVLRPQSDHAFLMAFGSDVRVWQEDTGNRTDLVQAVSRVHQPGSATDLYDALYAACADRLKPSAADNLAHRALIVLSDGDDTGSLHTLVDVAAIAQRQEVQIYALTIHPRGAFNAGDSALRRLADETGGRFFLAASAKELTDAFGQMEQELRGQYLLAFAPQQPTPGFHTLQIAVRAPRRLQVNARRGYYAAPN